MKRTFAVLFLFLVLASCDFKDPIESNFILSGQKKPSWFKEKYAKSTTPSKITFDIHTSGKVDITIRSNTKSGDVVEKIAGKYGGSYGLPGSSVLDYPRFMVVEVDDYRDVYEIASPGPIIRVAE
jgi:hypothetical protein